MFDNQAKRLTDGDRVDHDGDFCEAPAHDDGADGELVLERPAQDEEAAEVQRHSDVAGPIFYLFLLLWYPVRSDVHPSHTEKKIHVPETDLGLEDTLVPPDAHVHDPFVRVPADDLAQENCDLLGEDSRKERRVG